MALLGAEDKTVALLSNDHVPVMTATGVREVQAIEPGGEVLPWYQEHGFCRPAAEAHVCFWGIFHGVSLPRVEGVPVADRVRVSIGAGDRAGDHERVVGRGVDCAG